jgi:hypothetical protein
MDAVTTTIMMDTVATGIEIKHVWRGGTFPLRQIFSSDQ